MNTKITEETKQKAIDFLDSKLGTSYKLGEKDNPIDCSGLITRTMERIGEKIRDGSWNQWQDSVAIPIEIIDTGDYAFFKLDNMNGKVTHIGMVAVTPEGIFVYEASGSKGGVVKTPFNEFIQGRKTHSGAHIFAGVHRPTCILFNEDLKQ